MRLLEQIFFNVNPTLKQLADNTQRTSDLLQKQSTKESKEKAKATRAADFAELSPDMDGMGEDLLGSMDPDMFQGRSGRNLWKDWKQQREDWDDPQERRPGKEKRERASGDQSESAEAELPSQACGSARASEDAVPAEAAEEAAISEDAGVSDSAARERGAEGSSDAPQRVEAEDAGRSDPSEKSKTERDVKTADYRKAPQRLEPSEPGEDQALGRARKPIVGDAPAAEFVKSRKERGRKKDLPEKASPESARPGPSHESLGLLNWGEGFLLAEQGRPASLAGALGPGWEAPGENEAPALEKARDILHEMIAPECQPDQVAAVSNTLCVFGANLLALCRDFGIRIHVITRDSALLPLAGLDVDSLRALRWAYVPSLKACLVKEDALTAPNPGFNGLVLSFCHAFDHALGGESFASVRSPAVLSNYRACLSSEPGRMFPDGYSALSPTHYFAQALESYLSAPFGKLTGPDDGGRLFTKEDLYDLDRPMFQYIDYLFREINKGTLDSLPL